MERRGDRGEGRGMGEGGEGEGAGRGSGEDKENWNEQPHDRIIGQTDKEKEHLFPDRLVVGLDHRHPKWGHPLNRISCQCNLTSTTGKPVLIENTQ